VHGAVRGVLGPKVGLKGQGLLDSAAEVQLRVLGVQGGILITQAAVAAAAVLAVQLVGDAPGPIFPAGA
jgi:hypothetical protein